MTVIFNLRQRRSKAQPKMSSVLRGLGKLRP